MRGYGYRRDRHWCGRCERGSLGSAATPAGSRGLGSTPAAAGVGTASATGVGTATPAATGLYPIPSLLTVGPGER